MPLSIEDFFAMPTKDRHAFLSNVSEKPEKVGATFFAGILSKSNDTISKWYAIKAIGDLRASDFTHLLLKVLSEADAKVGKSTLHRIGAYSIGKIGSSSIPGIIALLRSPDKETQIAAIDALGEIRSPECLDALALSLKIKDSTLVLWACLSLSKIGDASIPILEESISYIQNHDMMCVLDAFVKIGTQQTTFGVAKIAETHPELVEYFFRRGDTTNAKSRYIQLITRMATRKGVYNEAIQRLFLLISSDNESLA